MHRLNCRPVAQVELKGVARQVDMMAFDWRDDSAFPTRVRFEETQQEMELPLQDIISFGRLREHEGTPANDVVLAPVDPALARHISRWHFELRRFADGYRLRPVSEGVTEIDGALVGKGTEVMVRPGAKIRVARILTLTLISPQRVVPEDSAATRLVTGRRSSPIFCPSCVSATTRNCDLQNAPMVVGHGFGHGRRCNRSRSDGGPAAGWSGRSWQCARFGAPA